VVVAGGGPLGDDEGLVEVVIDGGDGGADPMDSCERRGRGHGLRHRLRPAAIPKHRGLGS